MTRAELKAYCLQLLNDPLGGFFDDTFMYPALNRAQEEVQKQLIDGTGELYYLKTVQTPLVVNQADYIWPSDLLKIHRLAIILSGVAPNQIIQPIMPMTLNQIGYFGSQTGTPSNYILKQDRFTLCPTPDNTQDILLYYSYKIADLTSDSQVPDIPEEYQKMIAVYAAIEGKVKDESNPSNLLALTAKFEKNMREMATDRQYQTPRMVVEIDADGTWTSF